MVDTNQHTGARLTTKAPTEAYKEGWDRIFQPVPEQDEDIIETHIFPLEEDLGCV